MNFPMLILTIFSQTVSFLNLSFLFSGAFGISIVRPDFFIQKYPNGKIWPLIISKNETHNQNDAQFRNQDDEWKTDQQKIVNLIEGNQNSTDSSSKGGTYNPRKAWETIDRGRSSSITHTKNDLTYNLEIQGHESSSLHNQTEEIESRSLDDSVFGTMNDMDNVILEDIRRKHVIGGTYIHPQRPFRSRWADQINLKNESQSRRLEMPMYEYKDIYDWAKQNHQRKRPAALMEFLPEPQAQTLNQPITRKKQRKFPPRRKKTYQKRYGIDGPPKAYFKEQYKMSKSSSDVNRRKVFAIGNKKGNKKSNRLTRPRLRLRDYKRLPTSSPEIDSIKFNINNIIAPLSPNTDSSKTSPELDKLNVKTDSPEIESIKFNINKMISPLSPKISRIQKKPTMSSSTTKTIDKDEDAAMITHLEMNEPKKHAISDKENIKKSKRAKNHQMSYFRANPNHEIKHLRTKFEKYNSQKEFKNEHNIERMNEDLKSKSSHSKPESHGPSDHRIPHVYKMRRKQPQTDNDLLVKRHGTPIRIKPVKKQKSSKPFVLNRRPKISRHVKRKLNIDAPTDTAISEVVPIQQVDNVNFQTNPRLENVMGRSYLIDSSTSSNLINGPTSENELEEKTMLGLDVPQYLESGYSIIGIHAGSAVGLLGLLLFINLLRDVIRTVATGKRRKKRNIVTSLSEELPDNNSNTYTLKHLRQSVLMKKLFKKLD